MLGNGGERLGLANLDDLAEIHHRDGVAHVRHRGEIVEIGEAQSLAANPQHPYTQALFSAALPSHPDERREEIILPGEVPSPLKPPSGCRFHPRCPHTMERCSGEEPRLKPMGERLVACHLYDERGPA